MRAPGPEARPRTCTSSWASVAWRISHTRVPALLWSLARSSLSQLNSYSRLTGFSSSLYHWHDAVANKAVQERHCWGSELNQQSIAGHDGR